MHIQVNGQPRQVAAGTSIEALLHHLQLQAAHVVVERNNAIVGKERYATELLVEGDTLEIVQFVGGG